MKNVKICVSKVKPSKQASMQRKDGSKHTTPQDNAEVFHMYFTTLYDQTPFFQPDIINLLEQLPT
eukprot:4260070-Ditylum_brightwellii.AAC.1